MNKRANIVEFIGAPGVGKSSVYKALCRSWDSKQNWVHQNILLYSQKKTSYPLLSWINYKIRSFLKINFQHSLPVNGGVQYVQDHESLAKFYWDHLSNPEFTSNEDMGLRFRSAFFLFRDFCKYQAIHDNANGKVCVIDEGVLQKSFLIHEDVLMTQSLLDEYFSLCELPKAVFWVHVESLEIILERLTNRHKYIASHVGKNEESLMEETKKWAKLIKLIADQLEKQGVKVYQLDGTLPIKNNVEKVKEILINL